MKLSVKKLAALLTGVLISLTGCKDNTPDIVVISETDAKEVAFEDVATNVRVVPLVSD